MATQIQIKDNGKVYTLEFNRSTASAIESQGFELGKLTTAPNIMIPLLFRGAFMKNHKGMKIREIEKIFERITEKTRDDESLVGVLADMYAETLTTLTENADEDEGNGATWEVLK